MVTKTITVTEDAYNLLADNKLDNESFSGELKRILTTRRKKSLMDIKCHRRIFKQRYFLLYNDKKSLVNFCIYSFINTCSYCC